MSSPARLRAALTSVALAAGLALTVLPTTTSAPAAAAPAASAADAATPAVTAGTASGFTLHVRTLPSVASQCLAPVGTAVNTSLDRGACGYVEATTAGTTGTITADLYGPGATTPFMSDVATTTTTAGLTTIPVVPSTTWPAGTLRLVLKDSLGTLGEFPFGHDLLAATVAVTPATVKPGTAASVAVTVSEQSGRPTFTAHGVPATFKLRVSGPDGTALFTSATQTASTTGTATVAVPASATQGITEDRTLSVRVVDAAYTDPVSGAWSAAEAGTGQLAVDAPSTTLQLRNSFVSSVGWVKPGEQYPSRISVTNPTATSASPSVAVTAPQGSTFLSASGPGTHPVSAGATSFTWAPGTLAPGASATLVLQSRAATVAQLDTIVWRDLSTTAVMTTAGQSAQSATAHGPKVIPPSEQYDTARYGDRPFPVVPVQYTDRSYQASHSGEQLETVIDDPAKAGSTFNLYQEMSLGQLFPDGTVPSAGIASADFASYAPGFDLTKRAVPGNTCAGFTYSDLGAGVEGTPLYPQRITDGVYNLPGNTGYYGSDSNGSAVVGSATGVGALQNIDSGCGDTGKLVYDAAALADPEIDYSDYDTDKDGVVDFFMVVYAGCGGNGASQLGPLGCQYGDAPYDNVWPHSSTLMNGYSDPVTGLPGFTTDDQLKDLEGRPLWYTDTTYTDTTTTDMGAALVDHVRVGPYNVNPETAIDQASVISHEYGHSLGLPDFYSTGSRTTYGAWNLMAEDRSQNMDAFSRQELGWVVPRVLDTSRTVTGFQNSKKDIGTIDWRTADGTPYTLRNGADGIVHNSEMYVAKLPGRKLLDASAFDTGDKATASHLWWSGSGNDFGCSPSAGRNFDLAVPGLATLPAGSKVNLSFKSNWDIEWDFDYGYVLTTTDGGKDYTSHASQNGYTTSNSDPLAGNPNSSSCQTRYDNGITGTSGCYAAGSQTVDRKAGNTPAPVFLKDSYDVSDLAGTDGSIRFTYATDSGLARPGWFVDDVTVTATLPDGTSKQLYGTDFETSGGPDDPAVYNGGCHEDLTTAQACTLGWRYLQAGAASAQDHAYYLEMRDRSGFDFDGHGEADRGPATFQAGLYLAYTDEAHGYGNTGTDDPPAQSPLDAVPVAGSETPDLDDAAFTAAAGRSSFTDSGAGHTDNYTDPTTASGNWEFKYDCLGFDVTKMSGEDAAAVSNLTGDVTFTIGQGCGAFDYGYGDPATGPGTDPGTVDTAPTAQAAATPAAAQVGQAVQFSGAGSTDAETPDNLTYSWNFGDGSAKASGLTVSHAFARAGTYAATLTVSDPEGRTGTATTRVVVTAATTPPGTPPGTTPGIPGTGTSPVARIRVKPHRPGRDRKVRFVAKASTGTGTLTYAWNLHNGGRRLDGSGRKLKAFVRTLGKHKITLTVTDATGATSTVTVVYRVHRHYRR